MNTPVVFVTIKKPGAISTWDMC